MPTNAGNGGGGELFQLLRDGVPRTRAELAKASGLARPTVAARVEALMHRGLIRPVGDAASTGGRPPSQFALNPGAKVVVGIDVGASHTSVAVADLAAFAGLPDHGDAPLRVDWVGRLRERFVAGDDSGAWATVEAALAAGRAPDAVLSLIGEAVRRSDEDENHLAGAYLAVGTAQRTLAVLASRFRTRGRRRGTVLLGAPGGEGHGFALSMLAVTLRLRNLGVLELGTGVPAAVFVDAGRRASGLLAVGLGVTAVEHLEHSGKVIAALRAQLPDVPIVLGGQAVRNPEIAEVAGADMWTPDIAGMIEHLERLAPRPRRADPVPALPP